MMMLMTAALAAAAPAVSATPAPDGHARLMSGSHEQKDCCPCCKDMAGKHGGRDQHQGHTGQ